MELSIVTDLTLWRALTSKRKDAPAHEQREWRLVEEQSRRGETMLIGGAAMGNTLVKWTYWDYMGLTTTKLESLCAASGSTAAFIYYNRLGTPSKIPPKHMSLACNKSNHIIRLVLWYSVTSWTVDNDKAAAVKILRRCSVFLQRLYKDPMKVEYKGNEWKTVRRSTSNVATSGIRPRRVPDWGGRTWSFQNIAISVQYIALCLVFLIVYIMCLERI